MTTFASASQSVQNAVYAAAAKFGVDPAYLFAIGNNESGLNGTNPAVGGQGEIGTFQILPSTATSLGYSTDPNSPNYVGTLQNNADAAAKLLSQLEETSSDPSTIFANYNEGSGNIAKYGIVQSTQQYVTDALAGVTHYAGGSPTATGLENGGTATGASWQDQLQQFITGPGSNSGSGQPTGSAKELQKQTVQKEQPWFDFISNAITGIETNLLLGGLALALVAGGFTLLAVDNKNVRSAATTAVKGLAV